MNRNTNKMKGMGFYAIILVLLVVTVSVLLQQDTAPAVTYAQVVEAFENEQVDSFVIDGNTFEATLKDNSRMEYRLPSVELFFNDLGETIRQQKADGSSSRRPTERNGRLTSPMTPMTSCE